MKSKCSIFAVAILVLFNSISPSYAEVPVKQEMRSVYGAFKSLHQYLVDEERFLSSKNQDDIIGLVTALQGSFHSERLLASKSATDPGFTSTLEILNEMLDDSKNRLAEGRASYARWRLKTAMNYCVTCHTRHEVQSDFEDFDLLDGLNAFQQGEFFLASRQFEKASQQFLNVVSDKELRHLRMEALQKWLIVYTRVHPDPHAAIKELSRVQGRADLTEYERREIREWLVSLRRWASQRSNAAIDPLRRAENLIRQGLGMHDPLSGEKGTVELLRATALLHQMLDSKSQPAGKRRAKALYSLGLAYSELPSFFINELPEMFLEQAIREYPGTEEAQRAFKLFQRVVTLGYTGSGGVRVPDDVKLTLQTLHDIAYGVKQFDGRV
jgi:hypothetical protein